MTRHDLPKMLDTSEVAEYLGVPVRTLDRWRLIKQGVAQGSEQGPPFVKFGRQVRYPEDALLEWVRARTVTGEN